MGVRFRKHLKNAFGETVLGWQYTNAADNATIGIGALGRNAVVDMGEGDDRVVINGASAFSSIELSGGVGRDTLTISQGALADYIYLNGGADDDFLVSEASTNTTVMLYGGHGNDALRGGLSADELSGDEGNDEIVGGFGNDAVNGGIGYDRLNGGVGDDYIFGDLGADYLFGDAGADVLIGGAGQDQMYGGDNDKMSDTFIFQTLSDSTNTAYDYINDFEDNFDKIDLSDIDANSKLAGNQSFSIAQGFTKKAGQLVIEEVFVGAYFLKGDTNGDAVADFTVKVGMSLSTGKLGNNDFIF